jgi:hypothetical protein
MSTVEAAIRRAGRNGTAMMTLIAVVQVMWLAAIAYGVVWLVT